MRVVIHSKPDLTAKHVRLFTYSIAFKKYPKWVYLYDCEYFPERNLFYKKDISILNHIIERIYESTHDVPNCEDCELVEEPVDYRRMMMEDRD